jgi:hypothetical protein
MATSTSHKLTMATSTSHNRMSHHPTAHGETLANSACDRRRRAQRHAAGIGRAIDYRAVAPSCWIVHPLVVGVGVVLVLLVMTDLAIMVMALS